MVTEALTMEQQVKACMDRIGLDLAAATLDSAAGQPSCRWKGLACEVNVLVNLVKAAAAREGYLI